MWDPLTALDTAFLDAEDEDPHASLAIASVAVFEGPVPRQDEIVDAIRARLPLVPRYRRKLRRVPFDLGSPVWVDDPRFDIRYHLRRTAVPAPGDDEALCRLVARVMSQRLDRDRPLWECWVAEGLSDGRWAVISKVHHAMADGMSGVNLYDVFYDHEPRPAPAVEDDWSAAAEPSTLTLTARALRDLALSPVEQVRLLGRAARSPAEVAQRVYDTGRGMLALMRGLAPASPTFLSGPIGQYRAYSLARAPLPDVYRVAKAYRVSINDVALAAISGGYRRLLLARGEKPDPYAVRTLVPVSVRVPGQDHTYANRVSLMLAVLPVDIAGPVSRLHAVHQRLHALKASKEAEAGEALTTLAGHEPFFPISWGIRLAARIPQRSIITVTTNVPGSRVPLYLLGRRMLEVYPYVPIAVRLRTGVSVLTYCDRLTFGVTADFASAPEPQVLAHAIEEDMGRLIKAVRGRRHAPAGTPVAAAP